MNPATFKLIMTLVFFDGTTMQGPVEVHTCLEAARRLTQPGGLMIEPGDGQAALIVRAAICTPADLNDAKPAKPAKRN